MATKYEAEERAAEVAKFIVANCCTLRQAARVFNVSKSTIHTDINVRLRDAGHHDLYEKCREVLDHNKSQRHIRGGFATKEKFCDITDEERARFHEEIRRGKNALSEKVADEIEVAWLS